ncbi:MAG: saccharopine dehydrogenase NADP-binding domain-containing protein [candidate division Zixibacteria bacterium]|nr:saccharopine dehydrogenase NADP-binding domain-containing protein [candidate division Zixibacteria bacterium]
MKIAVIGAGLMGQAAVYDLCRAEGVTAVGVFDIDARLAVEVAKKYGNNIAIAAALDAGDVALVTSVLKDYDAALSCVTYKFNPGLTMAAISAKCHLVDLGGNNDTVAEQLAMNNEAEKNDVIIIPDCGLAPGMVAVLCADAVSKFDQIKSVKIRVGGLPQNPRPPLNYQMVFSAEGLINEYWEPCLILENGQKKIVEPMSGIEQLEFESVGKLEAFYTSGGTSTLPDTYLNKIDFLDYKTIRYPGHCMVFKTMLEIGLASREEVDVNGQNIIPRELFKTVLDKNLSFGEPDLVLVRLTAEGTRNAGNHKVVYELIDRQDEQTGLTAMMRSTSFSAAIVAWMAASGKINKRGCQPQELVVDSKVFIKELRKRGLNLTIEE